MRLVDADKVLSKIKNPYERAEVARWLDAAPTVEITWSSGVTPQTMRYCKKCGYGCEFAKEDGYCQITCCVKDR